MVENKIFTEKAMKIIEKKLRNEKLTQQDSNYLSRFVRPKLRDIAGINAEELLKKLEYNQTGLSIERKIKKIILNNVKNVDSIIICGSAIQSNYKEYNDIDVIVVTKNILTKSLQKKNSLIKRVEEIGWKQGLNLDIQIYAKNSVLKQYHYSPSLIYQLKDSKIIYGNLKIPNKINLTKLDLKMKLDYSEGLNMQADTNEIFYAIRNAILVLLLMNKKIDNFQLRESVNNALGKDLINKLISNKASKEEKKLALCYLNLITKHLEKELTNSKWEKIELESH